MGIQFNPVRSSEGEGGRAQKVEKSHEDVRLEEKVEPTIASDTARDQCKPDVHLPVILPDPQLYSAHCHSHPRSFPDFIPAWFSI